MILSQTKYLVLASDTFKITKIFIIYCYFYGLLEINFWQYGLKQLNTTYLSWNFVKIRVLLSQH